jgi:hypothetical protein
MSINLEGLIILVLFIAPGFLFSRASVAARPPYQKTPDIFYQLVLAVVGSILIHGILLGFLSITILVYIACTGDNRLIGYILPASIAQTPISAIVIYVVIGIFYISISMILAHVIGLWLGQLILNRTPRLYRFLVGGDPQKRVPLWFWTLVDEPQRSQANIIRIDAWLRSGECFEGNLVELRLSAEESNIIELALDDVIFKPKHLVSEQNSTELSSKKILLPNHRVLLRSADILWLARIDMKNE